MKLSLVVPVYKGEFQLLDDFNCKYSYLSSKLPINEFELIYVFDGSDHNSSKELKSQLEKNKINNVILITRKENKGKGFSVVEGFNTAQGDLIGYIDFGTDIGIDVIGDMLEMFKDCNKLDVVIANKYHTDSSFQADWKRKLASWGYLTWVSIATGVVVPDSQTGAKMYRNVAIKRILPKLLIKRFAFEVEILSALLQNGYKSWNYVPVEINRVDTSTVKIWDSLRNDVPRMFIDTLAVGYRKRLLNWYKVK